MTSTTYLSTVEVAERLSVHPRTVTNLARDGRLPGVKVGRLLRFHPDDLDAFLAESTLDSVVDRLVAEAPALTEAQRSRLSSLLQQPVETRSGFAPTPVGAR